MRVILEIGSGPDKGRKLRLESSQSITVGRTEWADFAVPHDPRISAQHFSIDVQHDTCHVRDLSSRNGTYVNGRLVPQALVKNGDVVVAGDTHFILRVDDGTPKPVGSDTLDEGSSPSAYPALKQRQPDSTASTPDITISTAAGGLFRAQCTTALLPPLELLDPVQRHLQFPLYLIVDFARLGIPCPPEIVEPPILFNWLPAAAAATSPVVIDVKKFPQALALVESGWGCDGVVCLASTRPAEELLQHLRSCVRVRKDAVLGFCWPGVFSALLASCEHEAVKRLVESLNLVLIESPEDPQIWQVYSYANLQMLFDRMGLPANAPAAPK